MASESIRILMGDSEKFSKLNALRWVTHLVGDMHQPLHIACSYIDLSESLPRLVFDSETVQMILLLVQTSNRREIKAGNITYIFGEYYMKDATGKNVKLYHLYGYVPSKKHFVQFTMFHDGPKDDWVDRYM